MSMITRFRNDFITGLAVLLPLAITLAILDFILRSLNRLLLEPIVDEFGRYIAGPYVTVLAKIVILLLIIIGIMLIGMAARLLLFRKFFIFWENMILKVPMVNKIYKGTKQLSKAFLGEGKFVFQKVALVEYPRKGVYSIGFITRQETKKELVDKTGKDLVNMFVPTAPNPTSGIFLVVPREDVILLDMSVEDGFKLVISAGAV